MLLPSSIQRADDFVGMAMPIVAFSCAWAPAPSAIEPRMMAVSMSFAVIAFLPSLRPAGMLRLVAIYDQYRVINRRISVVAQPLRSKRPGPGRCLWPGILWAKTQGFASVFV